VSFFTLPLSIFPEGPSLLQPHSDPHHPPCHSREPTDYPQESILPWSLWPPSLPLTTSLQPSFLSLPPDALNLGDSPGHILKRTKCRLWQSLWPCKKVIC
jgi:hypothetical protein